MLLLFALMLFHVYLIPISLFVSDDGGRWECHREKWIFPPQRKGMKKKLFGSLMIIYLFTLSTEPQKKMLKLGETNTLMRANSHRVEIFSHFSRKLKMLFRRVWQWVKTSRKLLNSLTSRLIYNSNNPNRRATGKLRLTTTNNKQKLICWFQLRRVCEMLRAPQFQQETMRESGKSSR